MIKTKDEQSCRTDREYNSLHTFAVCAYKESPYLEQCIRSLKRQSVRSRILIATSTPNDMIKGLAEKYKLPLYIREGEANIKEDWNFAYNQAKTPYVTLAHQDDLYHQDYVKCMLKSIEGRENAILFFSSYLPIRHGRIGDKDINCRIRRLLRLPLKYHGASPFLKRACLSMGNSICCPTAAYNKDILGESLFSSDMSFNIDWDTFYYLAGLKGEFVCYDAPLVYYRIHDGATSREFIDNKLREKEDMAMFCKFWPPAVAELIMKFYRYAYKTYD